MNNRVQLENEVTQLQNNVRFRKIDVPDLVELTCAIQRRDTFIEVTNDIRALLSLDKE